MTANTSSMADSPQTAEDWFILNQRGDLDDEQCLAFLEWLESDPQNEPAYQQVERTSLLMQEAAQGFEERHGSAVIDGGPYRPSRVLAIAASATLLAVVSVFSFYSLGAGEAYRTKVGEQMTVVLDDGSLVRLNTATEIRVRYSDTERRVLLKSGEAFFDVDPDTGERPFVVHTRHAQVRAIGTGFNVFQKGELVVVDVLEGVVEVLQPASNEAAGATASRVSEGFQLEVSPAEVAGEPTAADAGRITAWVNGRLEFDAAPLEHVVQEFNRYSNQELVIETAALKDILISGSFTIGRSEEFAHGLELAYPIDLVQERRQLKLVSRDEP